MKISIIYSNEYKHLEFDAERFYVRQWFDGKAEISIEHESGEEETFDVQQIKTISAVDNAVLEK